jgi:hypothetical protein
MVKLADSKPKDSKSEKLVRVNKPAIVLKLTLVIMRKE